MLPIGIPYGDQMTEGNGKAENDGGRRKWRPADFLGLLFFLALSAAVLPFVRDSYILQDVWLAICGALGID